jgi:transcriptional regulator with XRE-family HTH domain
MEPALYQAANSQTPPVARSVNSDMRRAAANLALVINECGLSQSELSRRSGISRQLINGWARQRVSVTLSSTVGQLLGGLQLNLADLLLDEEALFVRLGKSPRSAPDVRQIFPIWCVLRRPARRASGSTPFSEHSGSRRGSRSRRCSCSSACFNSRRAIIMDRR